MNRRMLVASLAVALLFLSPVIGCYEPGQQPPLANQPEVAVQSPPAGAATSPDDDEDIPQIARTDEELAVLLRRFEAGSKDREIAYYARESRLWQHRWRKTASTAVQVQSALEQHQRATTQRDQALQEEQAAAANYRQAATEHGASSEAVEPLLAQLNASRRASQEALAALLTAESELNMARIAFKSIISYGDHWRPSNWPEAEAANRRRFMGIHQTADRVLAMPLPQLRLNQVDLENALRFAGACAGAQLVVPWEVLKSENISPDVRVTLDLKGDTLGGMLNTILRELDPAGRAAVAPLDNVIVISTPEAIQQTRQLLADSLTRSDPAGRQALLELRSLKFTLTELSHFADYVAGLCDRRAVVRPGELVPKDAAGSISAECPLGLGIRLYLDSLGSEKPWTFRIVGGELIFEPAGK